MIILSVIFIFISVCDMSGVDCTKGIIPLQNSIINSSDYIYGLEHGDMSCFQMNHIPLFYVSLVLMVIASVLHFTKTNKVMSCLYIVIAIIPSAFVLITHNYVWFMIMLNIYLLLHIWGGGISKNKIDIFANMIALILGTINCIPLVRHLKIQLDLYDFSLFQMELIKSSNIILSMFVIWSMLYLVLLIKDIVIECNVGKTYKGLKSKGE